MCKLSNNWSSFHSFIPCISLTSTYHITHSHTASQRGYIIYTIIYYKGNTLTYTCLHTYTSTCKHSKHTLQAGVHGSVVYTFHRCPIGFHNFLFCSALCAGVVIHMLQWGRTTGLMARGLRDTTHTHPHTAFDGTYVPYAEEDRVKIHLHSQSLALQIRHCKYWCTPNTPHHCPCMLK